MPYLKKGPKKFVTKISLPMLSAGTQWEHVSTAVNKAGWILVDGSRIRQPDLVAFVGQLLGSCTAADVSS